MALESLSGTRGWLRAGTAVLVLNSAYLAAATAPGWFHYANLLLHPVLGLALAPACSLWCWRRRGTAGVGFAALLLAAATAAGVALLVVGNRSGTRGLLLLHVGLAVAGAAGLLVATRRPARRSWRLAAGGLAAAVAAAAAAAVVDGRGGAPAALPNPPAPASLAAQALGGAAGPFFPSAARTSDGHPLPTSALAESAGCGRAGCHPDAVSEWQASAHRWSGVADPWYRRSLEEYRAEMGAVAARWCAGCHDPALLLSGAAEGPPAELAAGPAAGAGVGCTLCHGLTAARGSLGQGGYEVALPPLAGWAAGERRWSAAFHDLLVHLDAEPHRRAFARPALGREVAAETCSVCHKAHLDEPLNGYRHFPVLNDYDSWQAASVSGRGARSFYWPERAQTCTDCHMPPRAGGGGRSHRFAAADTAAALLAGDRDQLDAVVAFLRDGKVSVDLFALIGAAEPGAGGDTAPRAAPLDPAIGTVRRGESVRLDVVVRNRGVGHLFPGGKNDAVECWLELRAVDAGGRVVFWSGGSGTGGPGEPVDPGAHFLRRRWIDGEGRPIVRRDDWRARAELYNQTLQPNTADVVRYRLDVPADAGPSIQVTARLNYRQFSHPFDQWVREGTAEPPPVLPVVVIAEDAVRLEVVDAAAPPTATTAEPATADGERWNDYGIGLLLQGDLRGARAAFERVTEIDPEWVDGWLNVARATTNEGDLEATRAALARASVLGPDLARVRYYQGRLEQALGDPAAALVHLRAAAADYPEDRLVRLQIGQLLVLTGDAAGAIAEMEAVLAVDPENSGAHYNLMRAHRMLGDGDQAERHQRLYERFRPDEAALPLARTYLERHPDDNRERQPIHEHRSQPLAEEPATDGRRAPPEAS